MAGNALGGTFFTQLLSNTNHAEFKIRLTGSTDARLFCAFLLLKGAGVRDLDSGEYDSPWVGTSNVVESNIPELR